jgi:hypothetical protein
MIPNRKIRFFNAGDRIQTTIRYSDPGGHDMHCIANYSLDAPRESFFEVPQETEMQGATIRLSFERDIMRDYGARGVIMVDANYQVEGEEEQDDRIPIAQTDQAAEEKGKRKWAFFVKERVKEFMEQCEMIRSVAGVPRPATGVTLRYLKIVGMVDPSEVMLREAQKQTSLVETLTQRLDRLEAENRELRGEYNKPQFEAVTVAAGGQEPSRSQARRKAAQK